MEEKAHTNMSSESFCKEKIILKNLIRTSD